MHIQYYAKTVYGNKNLYILNPDQANAIQTLTRKKTIDNHDIKALQALGHTTEQVPEPFEPEPVA